MNGEGRRCPEEGCEDNRGGYCMNTAAGAFGFAASAFYMPGPMNIAAPLGPALGLLQNNELAEGEPPFTECPRKRNLRE